ncbi:hypothetical protein PENTCL1PPCAC_27111, partial [Pristionchus entomophagus]
APPPNLLDITEDWLVTSSTTCFCGYSSKRPFHMLKHQLEHTDNACPSMQCGVVIEEKREMEEHLLEHVKIMEKKRENKGETIRSIKNKSKSCYIRTIAPEKKKISS